MIKKNCLVCEKEFSTYPCAIKAGKGKYCSKQCCLLITNKILEENGKNTRMKKGEVFDNFRGGHKINGYNILRGRHREHRKVVEDFIGRKLQSREIVHHLDENRLNNKLDNLVLLRKTNAHTRLHLFLRRHNLNGNIFKDLSVIYLKEVLPYAS